MSKIESYLTYKLTDYEEAAYLLARYFIERNFDGDVVKHGSIEGAYSAVISRQGLMKNLLGSRTAVTVTFAPQKNINENDKIYDGSSIQIETGIIKDGIIKEVMTYALVLPALRKLSDYVKILNLSKTKSLSICEKLKIEEKNIEKIEIKTKTEGKKSDKKEIKTNEAENTKFKES